MINSFTDFNDCFENRLVKWVCCSVLCSFRRREASQCSNKRRTSALRWRLWWRRRLIGCSSWRFCWSRTRTCATSCAPCLTASLRTLSPRRNNWRTSVSTSITRTQRRWELTLIHQNLTCCIITTGYKSFSWNRKGCVSSRAVLCCTDTHFPLFYTWRV